MIDFATTNPGDKLRITGMGAPGFAKLGDIVTVKACTAANNGRCDVVHDETAREAFFALTCGAQRLELAPDDCASVLAAAENRADLLVVEFKDALRG